MARKGLSMNPRQIARRAKRARAMAASGVSSMTKQHGTAGGATMGKRAEQKVNSFTKNAPLRHKVAAVNAMKSQHGSQGGAKMSGGGGGSGQNPVLGGKSGGKFDARIDSIKHGVAVNKAGQSVGPTFGRKNEKRTMRAHDDAHIAASEGRMGRQASKQYRAQVTAMRQRDSGVVKAARLQQRPERRSHSKMRREQRQKLKSSKRMLDLQEAQYNAQQSAAGTRKRRSR